MDLAIIINAAIRILKIIRVDDRRSALENGEIEYITLFIGISDIQIKVKINIKAVDAHHEYEDRLNRSIIEITGNINFSILLLIRHLIYLYHKCVICLLVNLILNLLRMHQMLIG